MALQKQFEYLKELATVLEKKEEVDNDLWVRAGVAKGTRLKDIQKQIQDLKKKVSTIKKQEVEDNLGEEAKSLGMSVEEYKEELKTGCAAKGEKDPDHRADKRKVDELRQKGKDKTQHEETGWTEDALVMEANKK